MDNRIVYIIEKYDDEPDILFFKRDGEVIRVTCASYEECGYRNGGNLDET